MCVYCTWANQFKASQGGEKQKQTRLPVKLGLRGLSLFQVPTHNPQHSRGRHTHTHKRIDLSLSLPCSVWARGAEEYMTSKRRVFSLSLSLCVAAVIPSPTSCIISFVVGAPNYDSVWLMRVRLRCDKVVRNSKRARRSHRLSLLLSNFETRKGTY